MFAPLPKEPDYGAHELEVLARWERDQTFDRLRELNADGPRFSFVDGPVTANNPMGVHHAWGRTLEGVFQRYKALRGYQQRYQNGFDCQGLWVEVGVEKSARAQLEARDRGVRARGVRHTLPRAGRQICRGDHRAVHAARQWMDWDNDYYTFTDTNIEYIWRFLKEVHERGWLYMGHRSTEWCPRCGTSISASTSSSRASTRSSSIPRCSCASRSRDREGESLVVWTTTPWTLPANVAAAVRSEGRVRPARRTVTGWAVARKPEARFVSGSRARSSSGWSTTARSTQLAGAGGRRAQGDPVGRGRPRDGHRDRPHRPGLRRAEDFELSQRPRPRRTGTARRGRPHASRGTAGGRRLDATRSPAGRRAISSARGVLVELGTTPQLSDLLALPHAARSFASRRLVHLGRRDPRQHARRQRHGRVDAGLHGKRMEDWLRNMGDWNISRKRYFGLPLPFYPCEACDTVNVIGSRAGARGARALGSRSAGGAAPALDRRGADRAVRLWREALRACPEVGDVWLDAGIVPFSTLGWQNPAWVRARLREGRRQGSHGRRPARPRLLGGVVSGRLGLGDARADPALVLLAAP